MVYAFINKSVGKGGANVHEDVMSIQIRLNRWIMEDKLPGVPMLACDGDCCGATRKAIGAFQKLYLGTNKPDCRVDPGGRTLEELFKSLISPQASEEAYQAYLKELAAAASKPAEAVEWYLSAADVADIRKNWGEEALAWARMAPNGPEAREFYPAKISDRYATVFGWKSAHANIACVANPNERIQFLAMLRDDMSYWLQRAKGDQQQATILQYTAACAIRDYRGFVVGQKMCPKAAYNRLVGIGQDVIYQMFLGMFQLLSPVGLSGTPAASGVLSDATNVLVQGMTTGKWPWTPTGKPNG